MTNTDSIQWGINEVNETFGVHLTPRIEKYQNSDDPKLADIHQWTWNFGNELKGKGYSVAYMHGPVGLYEGTPLKAQIFKFQSNNQLKEFIESSQHATTEELKNCVIFLYQKLPEAVRYDLLSKEVILENRKKTFKKGKKGLDIA